MFVQLGHPCRFQPGLFQRLEAVEYFFLPGNTFEQVSKALSVTSWPRLSRAGM